MRIGRGDDGERSGKTAVDAVVGGDAVGFWGDTGHED